MTGNRDNDRGTDKIPIEGSAKIRILIKFENLSCSIKGDINKNYLSFANNGYINKNYVSSTSDININKKYVSFASDGNINKIYLSVRNLWFYK